MRGKIVQLPVGIRTNIKNAVRDYSGLVKW